VYCQNRFGQILSKKPTEGIIHRKFIKNKKAPRRSVMPVKTTSDGLTIENQKPRNQCYQQKAAVEDPAYGAVFYERISQQRNQADIQVFHRMVLG
jgi:hypothetical protein